MPAQAPKVYIFWDNSNIFIPSQKIGEAREGVFARKDIRIHFENLLNLAKAGRDVALAFCAGSTQTLTELSDVWRNLKKAGVGVEVFDRGGESGSEQGVDCALQVRMLRALADFEPGVAVLLTGDGAGYEEGAGFHADLERMHRAGWGIEIISWDSVCNTKLKEWAQKEGAYIKLDDYYNSVTFLQGTRSAKALTLTHRPSANPSKGNPLSANSNVAPDR